MRQCSFCEGERGWLVQNGYSSDPYEGEEWTDCSECHGSGWECGAPEQLDMDDIEELAWGDMR